MIIFGHGKLGSAVSKNLSQITKSNLVCLTKDDYPAIKTIEEAEDKAPNFSLDNGPEDTVYFICSGEEKIAGGILRTLEKLKESKIKLTYILRDDDFLSEDIKKQQLAISRILQNYARSGLFEDISLVEEKTFKKLFMPQVSLLEYDKVFSETLAKMISMTNWLKNSESVYSDMQPPNDACRLNCMGVFAGAEEKLVFPLDNVRQKDVYFACSKTSLETDTELMEKIKDTLNSLKNGEIKLQYKIITTDYEQDFVYLLYHTNFIQ
jgi:hypothetical protein